ncbi:hypothetical protein [Desulfovulcanus sp.]
MHLDNWLERFALDDQILAQSYEQLGDVKRSWLKKLIAHLYNYYGRKNCQEKMVSMAYAQGFKSYVRISPWNLLVCVIDNQFKAANKVLAAIMPALMAGTKEIIVILENSEHKEMPEQILVGLELMGVENILLMDKENISNFMQEIVSNNAVDGLFCLGDKEIVSQLVGQKNYFFWSPRPVKLAGLVVDTDLNWDVEILSWANPDLEFIVLTDKKGNDWSGNFRVFEGREEDFWSQDFDVLFASEKEFLKNRRITLGFGPGQESSWIWPELDGSFFYHRQIFWSEGMKDEG